MDESMVNDYPLVDITQRIATVENMKYPMAGMKSHEVTLNIYSLSTGKTVFLKTANQEQYLTNVAGSLMKNRYNIAVLIESRTT
jgi:dipeptidyl-peptidase-4